MKKQVVAISVVAALSLLGLPACAANQGEGAGSSSEQSQAKQGDIGQTSELSSFIDDSMKYVVTLQAGSVKNVVEYNEPVHAVGSPAASNASDENILFVFDCACLSDEGAEGVSSSGVVGVLSDHIMTFEGTKYRSIGRLQNISVASQSDMTVAGTQMTKYVGTLEGASGSRPFVGYAAVADDLATWFFVVDDSKDASNSQNVLEDWADKVAQTYRVVG